MRPTRKCEFCGKTFVPRSGMQKYCSEECQAEAKRLRKKRQQDLINGIEPIMDLQHQEYLTFSNIKYIDNQLVAVSKVQMICKCKYKTI